MQTLFAVSFLLAFAPGHARRLGGVVESSQEELFMAVAAFSSVISLLFMCKSILLFDPTNHIQPPLLAPRRFWRWLQRGDAELRWDLSHMPSKLASSYIIVGLGLLWSVLGAALLLSQWAYTLGSNRHSNGALGIAMNVFAGMCFTIAAFTTHGLGGHLRHSHPSLASRHKISKHGGALHTAKTGTKQIDDGRAHLQQHSHWRFFQPFKGGPMFIATQAAGWVLFSMALSLVFWGVTEAGQGAAQFLRSWALAAGTTGVVAELLLASSLLAYNAGGMSLADLTWSRDALRAVASHAALMTVLYLPMHVVISCVLLSFTVLPTVYAGAMWIGALVLYYSLTGNGDAEHTGRREWPAFQDWIGREVERVLPKWLGSFEVKVEPGATFSPKRRYVFAYLPHGLYPLGAAYLPHTPKFRKAVGGVRPVTLIASIVFQLPFLRDINLWVGARAVGKRTFVRTLRERGAVLVVPGGQRELLEAYRMAQKDAVAAMYTGHRGFVRLAIQENASLVPIVAFGEVTSLRNIIHAPKAQLSTYETLGFPLPFLMGGKLGILPLPSRVGLRFVVGAPLESPPLLPGASEPTLEQVETLHTAFYDAAEKLWESYSKDFAGYERIPMVRV